MNPQQVIQYISNWLVEYSQKSKTKGFVIGVSGGIDSAVTSTLAAKTNLPLLCIEMPIHQPKEQITRALEHIEWLKKKHNNVKSVSIELTATFDSFVTSLNDIEKTNNHDMALVNARARIRMTTLYYFAGLHNYLVTGTGNKVEDFGIGFFTKYGDGGVDISPIADLLKTEVYELGKELGIINSIMNAPPTDGLWGDNRTDEDQIGASYPELEWAMQFSGNKNDLSERQQKVLEIYKKLNTANQHKMKPIPVCNIPDVIKN